MWIIGNSSRRRTVSTGCEVIVASVHSQRQNNSPEIVLHRVLDRWNRLPEMVVDVDTVQMFNSGYDRFSKDMGN